MRIRAFIAIQPPAEWVFALTEVQHRLQETIRSSALKWVDPEKIHVTLRFFGSITLEDAAVATQTLVKAAKGAVRFTLTASELGCFPSMRRARVLWLGVGGAVEELNRLNQEFRRLTSNIGEPPEERAFKAHLTLARIKELDRVAAARLEEGIAECILPELSWEVKELLLVRSHLSSAGARYETIAAVPLEPLREV